MATLMASISGIRGIVGDGLDPKVLIEYTTAYADFIGQGTVIIGRDSRISGMMVLNIVAGTLSAKGINVIDIGICPTPTVQYTVKMKKAQGGIAISASHNPNEWNALKLLNSAGQFLSPDEYKEFQKYIKNPDFTYLSWNKLGKITADIEALDIHKKAVLSLPFIDHEALAKRKFKVVADCVNGAGYIIIPELLRALGCDVIEMNCSDSGIFPRKPEPLPENLVETMDAVKKHKANLGVVVDPDVDRLVLITDQGEPFSEENTITQAAKFILSKQKGDIVVNLSTTRAADDVAIAAGFFCHRSPVGEANVVQKMKEVGAVIGGEGSGGVIYPSVHYGRDALIGIAITLQHLLEFGGTMTELKSSLPQYSIAKDKFDLGKNDPDSILNAVRMRYKSEKISTEDGLRIDFPDHWVHMRKSNTEPIIRVICEAENMDSARKYLANYRSQVFEQLK